MRSDRTHRPRRQWSWEAYYMLFWGIVTLAGTIYLILSRLPIAGGCLGWPTC